MSKLLIAVGYVVIFVMLGTGIAHAASKAQLKCEQAKLQAQGTLQSCRKKSAAGVIVGKTDVSAACQTKFLDALRKADTAVALAGTSCRYIDNDETVNDLHTGLMWEKKTRSVGGGFNVGDAHDVNNVYAWSTSGTAADGPAFTDFLAKLNNGASTDGVAGTSITGCFANHCDWRLPTIAELLGIVSEAGTPKIDPIFGPTQSYSYWSATTETGNPTHAWDVYFPDGRQFPDDKHGFPLNGGKIGLYVRAVRGGL